MPEDTPARTLRTLAYWLGDRGPVKVLVTALVTVVVFVGGGVWAGAKAWNSKVDVTDYKKDKAALELKDDALGDKLSAIDQRGAALQQQVEDQGKQLEFQSGVLVQLAASRGLPVEPPPTPRPATLVPTATPRPTPHPTP